MSAASDHSDQSPDVYQDATTEPKRKTKKRGQAERKRQRLERERQAQESQSALTFSELVTVEREPEPILSLSEIVVVEQDPDGTSEDLGLVERNKPLDQSAERSPIDIRIYPLPLKGEAALDNSHKPVGLDASDPDALDTGPIRQGDTQATALEHQPSQHAKDGSSCPPM
ncbi:hypothetical protein H2201_002047 [Coniosporium apollinis]|uniref:BZIP domain-containing protein n=1 Tax=Coniosporium apollinis TaxID=61459 RepID=A0ABQ9NZS7_9PEZI|nr:hypothetical protein H2201_002047 [Coniosporium apollinis]